MSGLRAPRRSRTSAPPAERRVSFPSPPSAPPGATTSGSPSVRSGWRCVGLDSSLRAQRSNPALEKQGLDCFLASASRNDDNKQSHHILSAVDRKRRAGEGARLAG